MSGEGGFLARWSKRKRAEVADGAVASPPAVVTSVPAPVPEEEFDLSTLPSLDDLTGASDISVFLQKGVPDALKNAALRKAWVLDPMIKDHIEPVECGWDFNDPTSMAGFGPLDANTDSAAMLRQIMGEKDPAEASSETITPSEAGPDDQVAAAHDPAAREQQPLVDGGMKPAESVEAATDQADGFVLPDIVPVKSGSTPDLAAEFPVVRRKQRHGGALPG